ncbi:MAG: DUF5640 domain-containing protein [Defluviitaleaceae bacterium]|nr:DUF5640 domain-containing protein [Defluviitaleaceae bacterium]
MKKFFAIFSILAIGFIAGCAANIDEELVGVWFWEADSSMRYVLNEDGTGERGFPYVIETFTWEVEDDELHISRDAASRGQVRNEVWEYSLDGDILTLYSRQEYGVVLRYFAEGEAGQNAELSGIWERDQEDELALTFSYTFNHDGTGERGFPDDTETFTWFTSGERLFIHRDTAEYGTIRGEIWAVTVYEDSLILENKQVDGVSRYYTNVYRPAPPEENYPEHEDE